MIPVPLYILIAMKNISDRELIDKYITHCAALGLSADGLAALVRRTRSWGSLLVNGRIGRLRFVTRARIERILADADDNRRVGRGNHHATDTRRASF